MFWFVGTVVLGVWWVFRDPTFDYRPLIAGALLPLADIVIGPLIGRAFGSSVEGVLVLHSMTAAVVLLAVVMVATRGRRMLRKAALGVPIGLLVHLVVTGAWRRTPVFWWPVAGLDGDGVAHPVIERGWWNAVLEVCGVGLCTWIVRRAELTDPVRWSDFRRTGHLDFVVPVRR